jgi:two-component system, chemotaxis family, protein-glutamate methylesterase/glutaminase
MDGHVPVVAIGSSADGITALRALARGLGPGLPAAVVLVQHRAATSPSMLPKLLARVTPLCVKEAEHGEPLQAGTIYVAPVGAHVVVADGRLELRHGAKVAHARPSIDVLFDSVARVCGPRAIGVLMGGAGRDGAEGLAAIRRAGGATLLLDPAEARFPRMPREALAVDGHHTAWSLADLGPAITHLAYRFAKGVVV